MLAEGCSCHYLTGFDVTEIRDFALHCLDNRFLTAAYDLWGGRDRDGRWEKGRRDRGEREEGKGGGEGRTEREGGKERTDDYTEHNPRAYLPATLITCSSPGQG